MRPPQKLRIRNPKGLVTIHKRGQMLEVRGTLEQRTRQIQFAPYEELEENHGGED
jgi:hypothetical protein